MNKLQIRHVLVLNSLHKGQSLRVLQGHKQEEIAIEKKLYILLGQQLLKLFKAMLKYYDVVLDVFLIDS